MADSGSGNGSGNTTTAISPPLSLDASNGSSIVAVNATDLILTAGAVFPRGRRNTDPFSIILCIVLVLAGLVTLSMGFKLYRWSMTVSGYTLFSEVSWLVLAGVASDASSGAASVESPYLMYVGFWLISGAIGSVALAVVSRTNSSSGAGPSRSASPSVVGITAGLVLARLLRALFRSGSQFLHLFLLFFVCLLGYLLVHHVEKYAVIASMSLIGAYISVLGLDVVLSIGFMYESVNKAAGGRLIAGVETLYEAVAVIIAALVGSVFQVLKWKHASFGARSAQTGLPVIVARLFAGERDEVLMSAKGDDWTVGRKGIGKRDMGQV